MVRESFPCERPGHTAILPFVPERYLVGEREVGTGAMPQQPSIEIEQPLLDRPDRRAAGSDRVNISHRFLHDHKGARAWPRRAATTEKVILPF